jgi:hypothetical protein
MPRFGFYAFYAFFPAFCLLLALPLAAQDSEQGQHMYVIRGEVHVDMEPIYGGHVDTEYPLSVNTAGLRALEEASLFYSSMIYGWSFYYEVGERARKIDEKIELQNVALIKAGDPSLRVTETEIKNSHLWVWTDYHLSDAQQRRIQTWSSGMTRSAQGVGYAPSTMDEYPGYLMIKKTALEDAARAALRAMLRGSERNRPKEVTGFISLAAFPRFFVDGGRMAAIARFRVQIENIVPFAVY